MTFTPNDSFVEYVAYQRYCLDCEIAGQRPGSWSALPVVTQHKYLLVAENTVAAWVASEEAASSRSRPRESVAA